MTVSFIVATTGRPGLKRALDSIELRQGDELIVVGNMGGVDDGRAKFIPSEPRGNWGHSERNAVMPTATGEYLAHLDDDDMYVPGARALMELPVTAVWRPQIFKMRGPDGWTIWKDRRIKFGNVGTPMTLMPNIPAKLGRFGLRYGGDCDFLLSSKWLPTEYVWRPDVLALIRPV